MNVHWKGLTFTPGRIVVVAAIEILVLLGALLPYLTLQYLNFTIELVEETKRLFAAADLVGGLDPNYLPASDTTDRPRLTLALNLFAAGPGIQQVASVVVAITCLGLFWDEINKFLFWPLHLASYFLIIAPVPLWAGYRMLRSAGVVVSLGPGWVLSLLAGILVLVVTIRVRGRLDTYGGV